MAALVLSLFWAQIQLHARPYRFPEVRTAQQPVPCLGATLLTCRLRAQDNALKLMVEYVIFISLTISLMLCNPVIRDGWESELRLVLSAVYAARAGASRLHGVVVTT